MDKIVTVCYGEEESWESKEADGIDEKASDRYNGIFRNMWNKGRTGRNYRNHTQINQIAVI